MRNRIDYSRCAYVGYTRCSSDEQAKGYSHAYQRSGIERNGVISEMTNLGWYNDTVTGRNFTERTELDRAFKFLRNLQKQNHSYEKVFLIAYKTDRFGRTVEGCFGSIRKFKEIGVEVNFSEEWCDYQDDNWAMLLSVKFGIAETESRKIGSRTRDGLTQMALQGEYPYSIPFGYKRVATGEIVKGKEKKRVVKDENRRELVQSIFDSFLSGSEQNEIWQKINRFPLSKSGFYRIFQSPLYAGYMENPNDPTKLIKMNYEPYITLEQYNTIQSILKSRTHTTEGKNWTTDNNHRADEYWLKGILKCHLTGATMTAYNTTKKKSGHSYGYYQTAKSAKRQIISVQNAHSIVSKTLGFFQIDEETRKDILSQAQSIIDSKLSEKKPELSKLTNVIQQNESRLKNIFSDYADRKISANEYRQMTAMLTSENNKLSEAKAKIETILSDNVLNFNKLGQFVCNLKNIFQSANSDKKREVLRAIFPNGFSINPKSQKVRTNQINNVFFLICSESTIYENIEIDLGVNDDDNSVVGLQHNKVRTIDPLTFTQHAKLLLQAA